MSRAAFVADGFVEFPTDARVAAGADAALQQAGRSLLTDPTERSRWVFHGGVWFVGVDARPNADD